MPEKREPNVMAPSPILCPEVTTEPMVRAVGPPDYLEWSLRELTFIFYCFPALFFYQPITIIDFHFPPPSEFGTSILAPIFAKSIGILAYLHPS